MKTVVYALGALLVVGVIGGALSRNEENNNFNRSTPVSKHTSSGRVELKKTAQAWKPDAPAFVTTGEMEHLLASKADFATCRGVQRFGVRGSTYRRFDCTLENMPGVGTCYGVQVAALKAAQYGHFKVRPIKITGGCY